MDLKLQQAIVATRAGRTDIAQHLLTQLISEEPENSHAWFLLGHIVEPKDRQIRYLKKALTLDPENAVTQKHIEQLSSPPLANPIAPKEEQIVEIAVGETISPSIETEPLPVGLPETSVKITEEPKTPTKLPEWLQDLDNKKLVPQQTQGEKTQDWPVAAGSPKREAPKSTQKARVLHIPQNPAEVKPANDRSKEEVWLLRILAIMVIFALIVLGFLVLLILF